MCSSDLLTGKIVCPGFIDIHSHTDFILPFYSKMDSAIRQGITTTVGGMCGQGLAPVPADKIDELKKVFSDYIPPGVDITIDWNTFKEYLEKLDKLRCPGNLALCVGYVNIRIAGGQGFEDRPPTNKEMESMKEYVREWLPLHYFLLSLDCLYDNLLI